jgi:hypothetical protein
MMPQQHIGNNSYAYTLQQPIIAHGHQPSDTHYQTFKESTGQQYEEGTSSDEDYGEEIVGQN